MCELGREQSALRHRSSLNGTQHQNQNSNLQSVAFCPCGHEFYFLQFRSFYTKVRCHFDYLPGIYEVIRIGTESIQNCPEFPATHAFGCTKAQLAFTTLSIQT